MNAWSGFDFRTAMQIAAGCCEHNLGVTLEELPGELSLLDHFYYLKDGGVHSFRQAAAIY